MAFVAAVVQLAQKEGPLEVLGVLVVVARIELDVVDLLRLGRRRDAWAMAARIGRSGSGLPLLLLLRAVALQLGEGGALPLELFIGEGAEAPVLRPIRQRRLDGVEGGLLRLLLAGPFLLLLRLVLHLLLWLDEAAEEGGGGEATRHDETMRRAPLPLRTGRPEFRRGGVLEEDGTYLEDGVPEEDEFPDEVVVMEIRRVVH